MIEDRLKKLVEAGYPRSLAMRMIAALSPEFLERIDGSSTANDVKAVMAEYEAENKASISEDQ